MFSLLCDKSVRTTGKKGTVEQQKTKTKTTGMPTGIWLQETVQVPYF
jgi:hypothetical protein